MKGDLFTWQVYGLISVPKYTMKNGKDQMSFLELKDLRQESIFNNDFVENERYFNPSDNENILFLRDLVDVIAPFEESGRNLDVEGRTNYLTPPWKSRFLEIARSSFDVMFALPKCLP
jgi:hypothetical protein